ncbi:hypothetical protein LCGC14_2343310, partial [marine sediment metagenome]
EQNLVEAYFGPMRKTYDVFFTDAADSSGSLRLISYDEWIKVGDGEVAP